MIGPPEAHDFFYHLALLVHLDRVDTAISALVAIGFNRGLERFVERPNTPAQDIGKPQ